MYTSAMGRMQMTAVLVILAAGVGGCRPETPPSRRTTLDGDGKAQTVVYRSPLAVAVAPDGKTLYVSDRTAGCVTLLDTAGGKKIRDVAIGGEPAGLCLSADGKTLYVAQRKANSIALIDTTRGVVTGHIPVGPWPVAVAVAPKSNRLYSCNRGNHTVSVVDLAAGREIEQIAVVRDPAFAAVTGDESRVVVANFLPNGAGTDTDIAAEVSILDTKAMRHVATVKLPTGSTMARGTWGSPDGRWAYVVHLLGQFALPITQLEQGWVHTTALSIIDLTTSSRLATVLLDDLTLGAADPWDVVGSADGKTLWISHRGVHEVSMVDIGRIHELLEGKIPPALAAIKDAQRENIWVRIRGDKRQIVELERDLTALRISGTSRRGSSGGKGPMGMALGPDERRLYVANYYEGAVSVLDAAGGKLLATISMGRQNEPDAARRGEIFFHDATRCYQRWHSCASCHLDGGRTDGLPWDFVRDGVDNPKDVISLVHMHRTAPHNRRATRPDPWTCMQTGVLGSHLMPPEDSDVDDLLAYVKSIKPEPNPDLPAFAAAARRGQVLFEGKADCTRCHPAPEFTTKRTYNVGITSDADPDGFYDTPSLIEAYRTGPYYHDGRAVTMRDALTMPDPKGLHGKTKDLTAMEIEDLIAYVLSL